MLCPGMRAEEIKRGREEKLVSNLPPVSGTPLIPWLLDVSAIQAT